MTTLTQVTQVTPQLELGEYYFEGEMFAFENNNYLVMTDEATIYMDNEEQYVFRKESFVMGDWHVSHATLRGLITALVARGWLQKV